jgi:hypothetical protein
MTALDNLNERIGEFHQEAVDCERQADAQLIELIPLT